MLLSLFLIFLNSFFLADTAPVIEPRVPLLPNERGCYHNSTHYENGQRIDVNVPCLNCSCENSSLMCYLRVCPSVRTIGQQCIHEKVEGDCCPKIWCPEVIKDKDPEERDHQGCYINDEYYSEGDQLPFDPERPCEVCYCIRNNTACLTQECDLKIENCSPVYTHGQCCPSRYNCTYDEFTPTPLGVTVSDLAEGCILDDGVWIADGQAVNSSNPCQHCYCVHNELVCAVHECHAPGEGCRPLATRPDQCCPEKYECDGEAPSTKGSDLRFTTVFPTTETSTYVSPEYLTDDVKDSKMNEQETSVEEHLVEGSIEEVPSLVTTYTTLETSPFNEVRSTSETTTPGEEAVTPNVSYITVGSSDTPDTASPEYAVAVGDDNMEDSSNEAASSMGPQESLIYNVTGITGAIKGGIKEFSVTKTEEEFSNEHYSTVSSGPESTTTQVDGRKGATSTPEVISEVSRSFTHDPTVTEEEDLATPPIITSVKGRRPVVATVFGGSTKVPEDTENESPGIFVKPEGAAFSNKASVKSGIKGKPQKPFKPTVVFPGDHTYPQYKPSIKGGPIHKPIPGEDTCRAYGVIYYHGDLVESSDVCKKSCSCIRGRIFCVETICQLPEPEVYVNCRAIYSANECCPKYDCGVEITKPHETIDISEVTDIDGTLISTKAPANVPKSPAEVSQIVTDAVRVSPESITTSTTNFPTKLSTDTAEEHHTSHTLETSTLYPTTGEPSELKDNIVIDAVRVSPESIATSTTQFPTKLSTDIVEEDHTSHSFEASTLYPTTGKPSELKDNISVQESSAPEPIISSTLPHATSTEEVHISSTSDATTEASESSTTSEIQSEARISTTQSTQPAHDSLPAKSSQDTSPESLIGIRRPIEHVYESDTTSIEKHTFTEETVHTSTLAHVDVASYSTSPTDDGVGLYSTSAPTEDNVESLPSSTPTKDEVESHSASTFGEDYVTSFSSSTEYEIESHSSSSPTPTEYEVDQHSATTPGEDFEGALSSSTPSKNEEEPYSTSTSSGDYGQSFSSSIPSENKMKPFSASTLGEYDLESHTTFSSEDIEKPYSTLPTTIYVESHSTSTHENEVESHSVFTPIENVEVSPSTSPNDIHVEYTSTLSNEDEEKSHSTTTSIEDDAESHATSPAEDNKEPHSTSFTKDDMEAHLTSIPSVEDAKLPSDILHDGEINMMATEYNNIEVNESSMQNFENLKPSTESIGIYETPSTQEYSTSPERSTGTADTIEELVPSETLTESSMGVTETSVQGNEGLDYQSGSNGVLELSSTTHEEIPQFVYESTTQTPESLASHVGLTGEDKFQPSEISTKTDIKVSDSHVQEAESTKSQTGSTGIPQSAITQEYPTSMKVFPTIINELTSQTSEAPTSQFGMPGLKDDSLASEESSESDMMDPKIHELGSKGPEFETGSTEISYLSSTQGYSSSTKRVPTTMNDLGTQAPESSTLEFEFTEVGNKLHSSEISTQSTMGIAEIHEQGTESPYSQTGSSGIHELPSTQGYSTTTEGTSTNVNEFTTQTPVSPTSLVGITGIGDALHSSKTSTESAEIVTEISDPETASPSESAKISDLPSAHGYPTTAERISTISDELTTQTSEYSTLHFGMVGVGNELHLSEVSTESEIGTDGYHKQGTKNHETYTGSTGITDPSSTQGYSITSGQISTIVKKLSPEAPESSTPHVGMTGIGNVLNLSEITTEPNMGVAVIHEQGTENHETQKGSATIPEGFSTTAEGVSVIVNKLITQTSHVGMTGIDDERPSSEISSEYYVEVTETPVHGTEKGESQTASPGINELTQGYSASSEVTSTITDEITSHTTEIPTSHAGMPGMEELLSAIVTETEKGIQNTTSYQDSGYTSLDDEGVSQHFNDEKEDSVQSNEGTSDESFKDTSEAPGSLSTENFSGTTPAVAESSSVKTETTVYFDEVTDNANAHSEVSSPSTETKTHSVVVVEEVSAHSEVNSPIPETTDLFVEDVKEHGGFSSPKPETTYTSTGDVQKHDEVSTSKQEITYQSVEDVKEYGEVFTPKPETTDLSVEDVKQYDEVSSPKPETTSSYTEGVEEHAEVSTSKQEITSPSVENEEEFGEISSNKPETTFTSVKDVKEHDEVSSSEPETTASYTEVKEDVSTHSEDSSPTSDTTVLYVKDFENANSYSDVPSAIPETTVQHIEVTEDEHKEHSEVSSPTPETTGLDVLEGDMGNEEGTIESFTDPPKGMDKPESHMISSESNDSLDKENLTTTRSPIVDYVTGGGHPSKDVTDLPSTTIMTFATPSVPTYVPSTTAPEFFPIFSRLPPQFFTQVYPTTTPDYPVDDYIFEENYDPKTPVKVLSEEEAIKKLKDETLASVISLQEKIEQERKKIHALQTTTQNIPSVEQITTTTEKSQSGQPTTTYNPLAIQSTTSQQPTTLRADHVSGKETITTPETYTSSQPPSSTVTEIVSSEASTITTESTTLSKQLTTETIMNEEPTAIPTEIVNEKTTTNQPQILHEIEHSTTISSKPTSTTIESVTSSDPSTTSETMPSQQISGITVTESVLKVQSTITVESDQTTVTEYLPSDELHNTNPEDTLSVQLTTSNKPVIMDENSHTTSSQPTTQDFNFSDKTTATGEKILSHHSDSSTLSSLNEVSSTTTEQMTQNKQLIVTDSISSEEPITSQEEVQTASNQPEIEQSTSLSPQPTTTKEHFPSGESTTTMEHFPSGESTTTTEINPSQQSSSSTITSEGFNTIMNEIQSEQTTTNQQEMLHEIEQSSTISPQPSATIKAIPNEENPSTPVSQQSDTSMFSEVLSDKESTTTSASITPDKQSTTTESLQSEKLTTISAEIPSGQPITNQPDIQYEIKQSTTTQPSSTAAPSITSEESTATIEPSPSQQVTTDKVTQTPYNGQSTTESAIQSEHTTMESITTEYPKTAINLEISTPSEDITQDYGFHKQTYLPTSQHIITDESTEKITDKSTNVFELEVTNTMVADIDTFTVTEEPVSNEVDSFAPENLIFSFDDPSKQEKHTNKTIDTNQLNIDEIENQILLSRNGTNSTHLVSMDASVMHPENTAEDQTSIVNVDVSTSATTITELSKTTEESLLPQLTGKETTAKAPVIATFTQDYGFHKETYPPIINEENFSTDSEKNETAFKTTTLHLGFNTITTQQPIKTTFEEESYNTFTAENNQKLQTDFSFETTVSGLKQSETGESNQTSKFYGTTTEDPLVQLFHSSTTQKSSTESPYTQITGEPSVYPTRSHIITTVSPHFHDATTQEPSSESSDAQSTDEPFTNSTRSHITTTRMPLIPDTTTQEPLIEYSDVKSTGELSTNQTKYPHATTVISLIQQFHDTTTQDLKINYTDKQSTGEPSNYPTRSHTTTTGSPLIYDTTTQEPSRASFDTQSTSEPFTFTTQSQTTTTLNPHIHNTTTQELSTASSDAQSTSEPSTYPTRSTTTIAGMLIHDTTTQEPSTVSSVTQNTDEPSTYPTRFHTTTIVSPFIHDTTTQDPSTPSSDTKSTDKTSTYTTQSQTTTTVNRHIHDTTSQELSTASSDTQSTTEPSTYPTGSHSTTTASPLIQQFQDTTIQEPSTKSSDAQSTYEQSTYPTGSHSATTASPLIHLFQDTTTQELSTESSDAQSTDEPSTYPSIFHSTTRVSPHIQLFDDTTTHDPTTQSFDIKSSDTTSSYSTESHNTTTANPLTHFFEETSTHEPSRESPDAHSTAEPATYRTESHLTSTTSPVTEKSTTLSGITTEREIVSHAEDATTDIYSGFTSMPKDIMEKIASLLPHSSPPTILTEKTDLQFSTTPHHQPHLTDLPSAPNSTDDGYCVHDNVYYGLAEQIPRKDPCEFCFCFRGDIICLQQTCPPPINGCFETPIQGFCCPRFHCPVQEMHFNKTKLLTTTTTTADPRQSKQLQTGEETTGCRIEGNVYHVHEAINAGPCLQCRCESGGMMKCEPQECKPAEKEIIELEQEYTKKRK